MVGEICPVRQDGKQGERNLRRPCSYPTCAIRSGKLFLRKRSRFLELIGSLVVAVPADYTRYLWTNCLHLGVSGGIVNTTVCPWAEGICWVNDQRQDAEGTAVSL